MWVGWGEAIAPHSLQLPTAGGLANNVAIDTLLHVCMYICMFGEA